MSGRLPRAVLFDAGGTLLREESHDLPAGLEVFLQGAQFASAPPGDPELLAIELESVLQATRSVGDREFVLFDWLSSEFRLNPPDAAVAELAIWLGSTRFSPAEGAPELVEWLAARDVALGVVSNAQFSGRTIAFELQRQGVLAPFAFVLSSADHGVRKPSASIFESALARLGVAPSEAWFVGDSWDCDVRGAAGVGMRAIWLAEEEPPEPDVPHVRVAGLPELQQRIETGGGDLG